MKGYIFYLEYDTPKHKKENKNNGNCLAVLKETKRFNNNDVMFDAFGAVQNCIADCVHITSHNVSKGYLRENCKRISFAVAEAIHPNLIRTLKSIN